MWVLSQDKESLVYVKGFKLARADQWANPKKVLVIGLLDRSSASVELGYYETDERTKKVMALIQDAITSNEQFFEMPALNSSELKGAN